MSGIKKSISQTDIKIINNVHIYRFDEFNDGNLAFFASYNKQGTPLITDQKDRVESILQPIFNDSFIEYALPIIDPTSNSNLGFVYIRLQSESFKENLFFVYLNFRSNF